MGEEMSSRMSMKAEGVIACCSKWGKPRAIAEFEWQTARTRAEKVSEDARLPYERGNSTASHSLRDFSLALPRVMWASLSSKVKASAMREAMSLRTPSETSWRVSSKNEEKATTARCMAELCLGTNNPG
jgi:hypothetical protein